MAARLMERYLLAKRPQVEDMLIAATALSRGEALATGNLKHFNFVPGLSLKSFRP
jgi:predicted nucleic acid-binding protein